MVERDGSNLFFLVGGIDRDGMDFNFTLLATVKYGHHMSFFFLSFSYPSPSSSCRAVAPSVKLPMPPCGLMLALHGAAPPWAVLASPRVDHVLLARIRAPPLLATAHPRPPLPLWLPPLMLAHAGRRPQQADPLQLYHRCRWLDALPPGPATSMPHRSSCRPCQADQL